MSEIINYRTQGTCCQLINIEIENSVIKDIEFVGGCNGNLQGIRSLVIGMEIEEVIKKLKGILCGSKATSCPDQLASCLLKYIEQKASAEIRA